MLINLSDVFSQKEKRLEFEASFEAESYEASFGDFKVKDQKPFVFDIVNSEKGRASVKVSGEITFEATCDKCLEDAYITIPVSFDGYLSSPDYEIYDEEDDSRDFMDDYELDTEALIYNEITVNWPVRILCREECKGLCPVCGQNLNVRDCGCDTFVPDPRMAVLSDIFNSNKEV